jgi:hypothetical protein
VAGKSPGLLRLGKGGAIITVEVMQEERGRYDDDNDDEFDDVGE